MALPYVLEGLAGAEVAWAEYQRAAERLNGRIGDLDMMLAELESSDPAILVDAVGFSQDTLFGVDWTTWLSDAESRQMVARIQRLDRAARSLRARREHLEILSVVDAEQQRRILDAARRLDSEAIPERVRAMSNRTARLGETLAALLESPPYDATLREFATAHEAALLERLDAIESHASQLGDNAGVSARVDRLRGSLWYRIHDDLPLRLRRYQARVEKLEDSLASASERMRRIEDAALVLKEARGSGARIVALSARIEKLLVEAQSALTYTGGQLIARLARGIRQEMEALELQVVDVRLAMARVGDSRLVAKEMP